VGDRADTDGAFATAVGARFALVLSGVTTRDDLPVEPTPALVADDLAAVVDQLG
jgi:ribonucleotide monophosphatase NagD (HAD superfamily)